MIIRKSVDVGGNEKYFETTFKYYILRLIFIKALITI